MGQDLFQSVETNGGAQMTQMSFDYEDVFMGARSEKPEDYFRSYNDDYRLRSLMRSVSLDSGKLLDIGCGGGMISESLPYYYPKGKIFGCDVSKTAIAYAKKFGSGRIRYSHIKGKRLPYKNNTFDVCICLDVLEHVPDVDFFLKEVRRVLKHRGKFFVIVPCEGQPFTYTWLFQKFKRGDNLTNQYFGHIHPEFTYAYVIHLLQKHGFSIKEKRYSEHWFYQFMHLLLFFLPKILLERIFGQKTAAAYSNSGLIRSPNRNTNPLLIVRNIWFSVFTFIMMYPMAWETILAQHIPFGAWKLHALTTVTKHK